MQLFAIKRHSEILSLLDSVYTIGRVTDLDPSDVELLLTKLDQNRVFLSVDKTKVII
jgi:hypothetical protein